MTRNLRATINFKKKIIKKETQKCEDTHKVDFIGDGNATSVYNSSNT